jgi:sec-independent protein translocase protein TatB
MFDVSFSELLLIGVIALVVIGPERLPKVARTLGHLVGRAQRYVNDVKTDIKREMDIDEIKNLKSQIDDAASTVKSSMTQASQDLRQPLDDAQKALKDASGSMENLIEQAKADIESTTGTSSDDTTKPETSAPELTSETPATQPVADMPVPDVPVPDVPAPDTDTLPLPGFDSSGETDSTKTRTGAPT